MKLLADENFPPSLISQLQKKLHNVKRVQKSARSTSDSNVVKFAKNENRIIITFDKDLLKLPISEDSPSVMLFSFHKLQPEEISPFLDEIINSISRLKRKKNSFRASFSKEGLEII